MKNQSVGFEKETLGGIAAIALVNNTGRHQLKCYIAPGYGANIVRFCVDGRHVIDFDPDALKGHDYTGTPVLYPTPNRVRDGKLLFEGRQFSYECQGRPPYEHGLVHYEKWEYSQPEIKEGAVSVDFRFECDKKSRMYEAFPIEHTISIKYTLYSDGIKTEYTICNKDAKPLPYGFALHPYFIKLSGDGGTYAKLPATKYMEATRELLPTGRLLPIDGLDADIAGGDKLENMDFDHVFCELIPNGKSEIWYEGIDFKMELMAGPTFSHLVFYTPKGKEFFCIENQTCSTDAHNMYDKGYKTESGLEIIDPYGSKGDFVFYKVIPHNSLNAFL